MRFRGDKIQNRSVICKRSVLHSSKAFFLAFKSIFKKCHREFGSTLTYEMSPLQDKRAKFIATTSSQCMFLEVFPRLNITLTDRGCFWNLKQVAVKK